MVAIAKSEIRLVKILKRNLLSKKLSIIEIKFFAKRKRSIAV